MSDKIKVSTDHLDDLASYLKKMGNKLRSASSKLDGIWMNSTTANHTVRTGSCRLSGNAGIGSVSLGSTRSTVRRYSNTLDAYEDLCKTMAKQVLQVKARFEELEAELSALANGDADEIGGILGFPADQSTWTGDMWSQYLNFSNDYKVTDLPGGGKMYSHDGHVIFVDENGNKTGEYDFGKYLFKENPFRTGLILPDLPMLLPVIPGTPGEGLLTLAQEAGLDVQSEIELGKKKDSGTSFFKDKDGKEKDKIGKQYKDKQWVDSDEEGVLKPEHTFIEVGVKNKNYGGVAMVEGGVANENGHAKGKAAALYGEYEMGGYGGLYGYDKNGNKIIAPGARGEIGGSVSLLHADGEAAYDFGPAEVSASGSVDVGKASGKLEGQIGWVDGEFAASAGVEAKSVLAEAKGSVGVKGDYVGVKATGSAWFGIGAGADVGYHDGIFSVELSAAVGVGLSGKVELDVSGAVDAVTDAAESIYDGAKEVYKGLQDFGNWLVG